MVTGQNQLALGLELKQSLVQVAGLDRLATGKVLNQGLVPRPVLSGFSGRHKSLVGQFGDVQTGTITTELVHKGFVACTHRIATQDLGHHGKGRRFSVRTRSYPQPEHLGPCIT